MNCPTPVTTPFATIELVTTIRKIGSVQARDAAPKPIPNRKNTRNERIEKTMGGAGLAQERLAALLECSTTLHEAGDELDLAESLASAAKAGTVFSNVAVIKPAGGEGKVQILAAKGRIALEGQPNLSRSLLQAALEGLEEAIQIWLVEDVPEEPGL